MKQLLILSLIILTLSCKKSKTEPTTESTTPVCETKTKVFEGKYEVQNSSKDTITIVFIHNNCPLEGVNTYNVYGLGKSYNNGIITSNLDINKVYEIKSDENAKSATTIGANCKWGIGTLLNCNYTGIGVLYFKKL